MKNTIDILNKEFAKQDFSKDKDILCLPAYMISFL